MNIVMFVIIRLNQKDLPKHNRNKQKSKTTKENKSSHNTSLHNSKKKATQHKKKNTT